MIDFSRLHNIIMLSLLFSVLCRNCIAVVISEDPFVTARPVEALRIALGLCAGDHETTVVLLGTLLPSSLNGGHRRD